MAVIYFYLVAAFTGILVKAVDYLEDVLKSGRTGMKYALGLAYGLLIGLCISYSTFSTLWIAVLFGQLLSGKIDKNSHWFGFAAALIFPIIFGIREFVVLDFVILFAAALLDEFNPLKWPRALRPAVKVAALAFLFVGRWDYFAAILAFDIFYYATGKAFGAKEREEEIVAHQKPLEDEQPTAQPEKSPEPMVEKELEQEPKSMERKKKRRKSRSTI